IQREILDQALESQLLAGGVFPIHPLGGVTVLGQRTAVVVRGQPPDLAHRQAALFSLRFGARAWPYLYMSNISGGMPKSLMPHWSSIASTLRRRMSSAVS